MTQDMVEDEDQEDNDDKRGWQIHIKAHGGWVGGKNTVTQNKNTMTAMRVTFLAQ